jgi:hypothetical protein
VSLAGLLGRFGRAAREEDAALVRQADVIYGLMRFVSENRALVDWFPVTRLSGLVDEGIASRDDLVALGVAQGWIEERGGEVRITDAAREWEPRYWASFR